MAYLPVGVDENSALPPEVRTRLATEFALKAATETALGTKLTEAQVDARVAAVAVAGAPANLNTLDKVAAAIGDDATYSTTVSAALGNRVRFDAAQTPTTAQQAIARSNIGAAQVVTTTAAVASADTDVSTTSSVDLTGLTLTTTSPGTSAQYVIEVSLDCNHPAGGGIFIAEVFVDGSATALPTIMAFQVNGASPMRMPLFKVWRLTGLSAGSHTIKVRGRLLTAGTAVKVFGSHSTLTVTGP